MTSTSATGLDRLDGDRNPSRAQGNPVTIELQCRSVDDDSASHAIHESDTRFAMSSSDGCNHDDEYEDEEEALPVEWGKTLACFLLLALVFLANLLSIAIIHDRTPEKLQNSTQLYPPLRDITFDLSAGLIGHAFPLSVAAELILVGTTGCVVAALILHAHRSIVLRRFFFLLSVLLSLRLVTMNATLLPTSDDQLYRCEARSRPLVLGIVLSRFVELASSAGLWLRQDIRYCGNFVYSGHAVVLIMNCLMADEYCPSLILNVAIKSSTACALLFLLVCRFDYTISLITAYYATTRVFWIYHTFANNASLKKRDRVNQICKEWWYSVFRYLEGNVKMVVPNRYDKFWHCDNRF